MKMNSKYFSFDVDKFFRDYNDNSKKLKFLKMKYDSVADSITIANDSPRVTGGLPKSTVETKVERRERIVAEIVGLEEYFGLCDKILKEFSGGEEQTIIKEYFIKGRNTRNDVNVLAEQLFCSSATFYRKVKDVRREIRTYVMKITLGA